MTTAAASSTSDRRAAAQRSTVDVFGIAWPRYKAEALVTALVVLVLGVLLTAAVGGATLAPAILTAAGSGVAVWWAARALHQQR
ncbi:hypothetical protein [Tsukamurella paurometabola]|uniref:Uncharacterized protein n=1 Tax=Tsukamurella paurometabola TaxID=2061 RepID=A0A3P8L4D1_TSUPA|nr:hypothetical protein [Tsukamurella paurometabola]UEA83155.1 hypothetical protein LK411_22845 [Tsukamurella paurometabola]VDR40245.1 Uncharacterised protein [Tsukamurella paurometabola]